MNINGIAQSALNAYTTKLSVTANNVANTNTDNFKPSEARINDNANQGVYVTISQSASAEADTAKDMVDLIISKTGIEANLNSIKVADEVTKSILDIVG